MLYTLFTSCIYYFRFRAAILAIWWVLDLFCFRYLVVLSYLKKVTKAFPLIPSGSKIADQNVGLGSFSPPSPISNTRVKCESLPAGCVRRTLWRDDYENAAKWRSLIISAQTVMNHFFYGYVNVCSL